MLVAAGLPELVDDLVRVLARRLGLLADELDLVVGHLDLEAVRDDLEDELARDGAARFAAERLA